jgi:hypothetical protein
MSYCLTYWGILTQSIFELYLLTLYENNFRLGRCQVCSEDRGKYRCPACGVVSCSLDCVKRHKTTAKCDGVRSKSEFVPIGKFSELEMLSGQLASGISSNIIGMFRPINSIFISMPVAKSGNRHREYCLMKSIKWDSMIQSSIITEISSTILGLKILLNIVN